MKFTMVYNVDCMATQELIESKCKTLNEDFRNEYSGFLNLYKKIPEAIRNKLPWNSILEFRAHAIILDDYNIIELHSRNNKQCFSLTMDFNETTLEAFSIIGPIFEKQLGAPIKALTRKALKHKIRRDMEAGGNVKILEYWEGIQ